MKNIIKNDIHRYKRQHYRYLPSYRGIFLWACMTSLMLLPWQQATAYSISMEYYHHNHQGSLLEVYDGATNKRLLSQAWSPWGERQVLHAAAGNENSAASLLSRGLPVRMGYTGHKELLATGLTFAGDTRLYDARLKRFLNSDDRTTGGIRGQNRYSYAYNNPISYIDPDGRMPRKTLVRKVLRTATIAHVIAATTIQAYARRYLYRHMQVLILTTKEYEQRAQRLEDINHHPDTIRHQLHGRFYIPENNYQTLRGNFKREVYRNLRHPPNATSLFNHMQVHYYQMRRIMRRNRRFDGLINNHSLAMPIDEDIDRHDRIFFGSNEQLSIIENEQNNRCQLLSEEQANASFLCALQRVYPETWQQALADHPRYHSAVDIYEKDINNQLNYRVLVPSEEWRWFQRLGPNIKRRGG